MSDYGGLDKAALDRWITREDDADPTKWEEEDVPVQCEWFALCPNEATREREHPILGPVPICDSCNEKVERLDAEELPPPENRPLTVEEAERMFEATDAARLAREEREESG